MSFANFSRLSLPYQNVYTYFMDVYSPASLLVHLPGVIANIINIIVFVKTGAKDNVTISLLTLSASDLAYLVVISPHAIFISVNYMVPAWFSSPVNWVIDIRILWVPFYWYAFVFYDVSTLITVYISVVRCACVAFPFKVKDVFTSRRTLITFTTFFICVFLLRLPMFIKKRFVLEFDELRNSSRVVVWEFDDGGLAESINDIVSRNIMPWSCFIIVVSCSIVMVIKLRESAKFRLANNSLKKPGEHSRDFESSAPDDNVSSLENAKAATKGDRTKGQILSTKEVRVLRAVVLVAVIFIICQIPFMAYSLARQLESQFDGTRGYGKVSKFINLFSVASSFSKFCATVNASVNILVYYNHNSRYRQCLVELVAKRPLGSKLLCSMLPSRQRA